MITARCPPRSAWAMALLLGLAAAPAQLQAQDLAPVSYRVRVPQPDTQYAHIEARLSGPTVIR